MVNLCCVPGCTYKQKMDRPDLPDQPTSLLGFPPTTAEQDQWKRNLRLDPEFQIKPHTKVCTRHFLPHFIQRSEAISLPGGAVGTQALRRPKRRADAVPTILPPKSNDTTAHHAPPRLSREEKDQARSARLSDAPVAPSPGEPLLQTSEELLMVCLEKLHSHKGKAPWTVLEGKADRGDVGGYCLLVAYQK